MVGRCRESELSIKGSCREGSRAESSEHSAVARSTGGVCGLSGIIGNTQLIQSAPWPSLSGFSHLFIFSEKAPFHQHTHPTPPLVLL